jgi:hypothetical protein
MSSISLSTLLARLTPKTGFPFPIGSKRGEGARIATGFEPQESSFGQRDAFGNPVIQITDESLGRYEFMPVVLKMGLTEYQLPNALIMIVGEKAVVETDLMDRGTVFEKVYERPYDISIITTIQSADKTWPADEYKRMAELYHGMSVEEYKVKVSKGSEVLPRDLVTLKCALTYPFLADEDNFLITKIAVLDNEGAEDMEMIQIDGRSNIEFELIIN